MTIMKSVTLNERKLKYIKKHFFNEYLFIICVIMCNTCFTFNV